MFPQPIHITRDVSDSLSTGTTRIEEYCFGNRTISIVDTKTVIADYDKSQLTEIDRAKGVYSVTPFEAVARAQAVPGAIRRTALGTRPFDFTDRGTQVIRGRRGHAVETAVEMERGKATFYVVVDSQLDLSREALAVITGAAWPQARTAEYDVIEAASERPRPTRSIQATAETQTYSIPLQQTITWELDGETVHRTNTVVRIANELPSPELIAIPPGARLVESRIVQLRKSMDDLDRLPNDPHAKP
jgi:hypothetical protein